MLEWSKENYGPMTWDDAVESCKTLKEGGHDDWRLPSIKELQSLVNYEKYNPATELPSMLSSSYWSSTTHADDTDDARFVDFYNGYDYWHNKSGNYYVRAVRG